MACSGHSIAQSPQPTHFSGYLSSQRASTSPGKRGAEIASAFAAQKKTHSWQALHSAPSITGRGRSFTGTRRQTSPAAFLTAPTGQLMPQTPQSTQRRAFISCRAFGAPLIACTGQARAQAVQPMQFSPITCAIFPPPPFTSPILKHKSPDVNSKLRRRCT